MRCFSTALAGLALLFLAACGGGGSPGADLAGAGTDLVTADVAAPSDAPVVPDADAPPTPDTMGGDPGPAVATATVGPSGGTVEVGGATLSVPEGALPEDVEITIRRTDDAPPEGYEALTPVFRFEPEGLEFARPASIAFDLDAPPPAGAAVYWTAAEGEGFERIEGTADGSRIVASVPHFSRGFVGMDERGPAIASFSPIRGINGETVVAIQGVRFESDGLAVRIGSARTVAKSVEFVSATEVRAVPGLSTRRGPIEVTTASGVVTSAPVYSPIPVVATVAPEIVSAGTVVQIQGVGLWDIDRIRFGAETSPDTPIKYRDDNGKLIQVIVPEGALSGPLYLYAPGVDVVVTGTILTVVPRPSVTAIAPETGPVTSTWVTLSGAGFTEGTMVHFGYWVPDSEVYHPGAIQARVVTYVSPTEIRALPSEKTHRGHVFVTNGASSAYSEALFTPTPQPGSPTPASAIPGQVVTFSGWGLRDLTAVRFGALPALFHIADATWNGAIVLEVTVPDGATTGPVSFESFGVTADSSPLTVLGAPSISGVQPSSGVLGKVEVTILGGNFAPVGTTVRFGADRTPAASVKFVGNGELRAVPAAGTRHGTIEVETPAGVATSTATFTPTPIVTGFSPMEGHPLQNVTIEGSSLLDVDKVRFGDIASPDAPIYLRDEDGTQIIVTVPKGSISGPLYVFSHDVMVATSDSFIVQPLPEIDSYEPQSGLLGKTTVTIRGKGFVEGKTFVYFGYWPPDYGVYHPPAQQAWVEFVSSTELRATPPWETRHGHVYVNNSINSTYSEGFFTPTPSPHTLTPEVAAQGQTVTLSGQALLDATAVRFGDVPATEFKASGVNSSSCKIDVKVPVGATTGPITVESFGVTGTSPSLTILPPPTVIRFVPPAGLTATTDRPGTLVTITGTGFQDPVSVTFGDVPADKVYRDSDTQVRASPGRGTKPGRIAVTSTTGTGWSEHDFEPLPWIRALTPASGYAGARVTLTGESFLGATRVAFGGGVDGTDLVVKDDGTLEVTVPQGAKTGPITVHRGTVAGIPSATALVVKAPPVLVGVDRTGARPGQTIRAQGSGLAGATKILLGSTPCAAIDGATDVSVGCVVPAAATWGPISVETPGGTAKSEANVYVTPAVATRSPTSAAAGDEVTLGGDHFGIVSRVTLSGVEATFVRTDDTQLKVTIPAGAASGALRLWHPAGFFDATDFPVQVLPPPGPTIVSVTPASGDIVTVTGRGFASLDSTVRVGTDVLSQTTVSPTQLTINTTGLTQSGRIALTKSGLVRTSADVLTLSRAPRIKTQSRTSGCFGDGVTLTGDNLASVTCSIGGVEALRSGQSAYGLTCAVPAGALDGPLVLSSADGTATAPFSVTGPVVASVSPIQGPVGATIDLRGKGFSGATAVDFGYPATSFEVAGDDWMRVVVPDNAGYGYLWVTTPVCQGRSAVKFKTTNQPSIRSISPAGGVPGATTLTIEGYSFDPATLVVTIGGAQTTPISATTNTIVAPVPASAQTGPVVVTTAAGTYSGPIFSVNPAVFSASPNPARVGDTVTITGSGLLLVPSVKFGGTAAKSFVVDDASTVRAVVAEGTATGRVTVTSASGFVASSAFDLVIVPSITGFSPAQGVPGSTITITGHALDTVQGVRFGGAAATFSKGTGTSLTATVPVDGNSGPVSVVFDGGFAESPETFRVVRPPVITGFSPQDFGTPGLVVAVEGQNLLGATSVRFGAVEATPATVLPTRVVVPVPQGAVTAPVRVETPDGIAYSPSSFRVVEPPVIEGFLPMHGPAGTTVRIRGTGLQGATQVTLGEASLPFVADADGILATVTPEAQSGLLRVTTADGADSTATAFDIECAISGIVPDAAYPLAEVRLIGTHLRGTSSLRLGDLELPYDATTDDSARVALPIGATSGFFRLLRGAYECTSAVPLFVRPPYVASFAPSTGVAGDLVLVAGEGFSAVTAVYVGDCAANFGVDNDAGVRLSIPQGCPGGPLRLASPQGTGTSDGELVVGGTQVTGFLPPAGAPGDPVTLFGLGLDDVSEVRFNGVPADFSVVNATAIEAIVPDGATTGPVGVRTPDGTFVSSTAFTVVGAPQITSFSPASGTVGTVVEVLGRNLAGISSAKLGGKAATFQGMDDTRVRVTVPAGAVTGRIEVVAPAGSALSAGTFTVTALPVVTSISPTEGVVGTVVTVLGSNLSGTTKVAFGGGVLGMIKRTNDAYVNVVVPTGAQSGPLTVTTGTGSVASPGAFTVVAPSGCTLTGATLCPGHLLVGTHERRIVKVDPATGETAAYPQMPNRTWAHEIAVTPDRVAYFLNARDPHPKAADGEIRRLDPADGATAIVTMGVNLVDPGGFALDADGTFRVADPYGAAMKGVIARVDPLSGVQTVIAEGVFLGRPGDVSVAPGGAFSVVLDRAKGILRMDGASADTTVVSSRTGIVNALAVETADTVLLADSGMKAIVRVDLVTGGETTLSTGGLLGDPTGLVLTPAGALYVTTGGGHILRVDRVTGEQVSVATIVTSGLLQPGVVP